ncbi:MAG: hypothetical protein V1646_04765 [bacterium]
MKKLSVLLVLGFVLGLPNSNLFSMSIPLSVSSQLVLELTEKLKEVGDVADSSAFPLEIITPMIDRILSNKRHPEEIETMRQRLLDISSYEIDHIISDITVTKFINEMLAQNWDPELLLQHQMQEFKKALIVALWDFLVYFVHK